MHRGELQKKVLVNKKQEKVFTMIMLIVITFH